jgi:predicted peptidase
MRTARPLIQTILAACALCAGGAASASPDAGAQSTPPANGAEAVQPPPTDPWKDIAEGAVTLDGGAEKPEATYRYRLIAPPAASVAEDATVPLVVFLHGAGERGDDNRAQLKHFAGWCATAALQEKHPCFVLAMQCPAGESWAWLDLKAYREKGELPRRNAEPTRAMRALMTAIDDVLASKPIDRTRIYLTGLSMGGFGSFDLASRRPGLFAAVVPICGGGDPATAAAIAAMPFYIVHGSDDPVVPVELSRMMRDAIAAAAADAFAGEKARARGTSDAPRPMPRRAPNPMYREYDKVGHDSWTPAYRFGDDGVLDWMFAQRRVADLK